MDTMNICTGCHKPLAQNAPYGLCPQCLIKAGLNTGEDIGPDSQAEGGQIRFVAPTSEELVKLFPQLEILCFIGQGGMGAVYKARQKALDRVVALKILPPGIGKDPAFAERFTREAKALARLNHPGVVTIYEFGQANGLFFFLMEFVDGMSLRHLLKVERISAREALAIVPQICDALQYAHDQGIVHRDIKPENILLNRQGQVKVADFGLAKLVGTDAGRIPLTPSLREGAPTLTDAGKIMGTPQYMAPEQREHPTEVDHRADIYSLGVVFYQMLTGALPTGKFEAPSQWVRVDVRLDKVVLRALEKDPERRYQQASQVKTDIETIASGPDKETDNSSVAALLSTIESGSWGWLETARWSARLLGLSLLAFFAVIFGLLLLGAGLPPLARQSGGTLLNYLAIALMILGYITGWKLEGTGAVLVITGWALWHSSNGTLAWSMFHLTLLVAGLYAYCWWSSQGRHTAVLFTAAGILVTLLVCGITFLPTNIYLYGTVLDTVTGKPIPNAELTIYNQPPSSSSSIFSWISKLLRELFVSRDHSLKSSELARSSSDGWFALHIGWYQSGKQVRITAAGYSSIQLELGPKPMGIRRVHREFTLSPEPLAPQVDATTNILPRAGPPY